MDVWNALLKTPCTGYTKIKNNIMPVSCMKQALKSDLYYFQPTNKCM